MNTHQNSSPVTPTIFIRTKWNEKSEGRRVCVSTRSWRDERV